MQETEIAGHLIMLPACHDGDKPWIASQLYNITTRYHEGQQLVTGIQRYAIMQDYECKYLNILENEGEQKARVAANILLRQKIANFRALRDGKTTLRNK